MFQTDPFAALSTSVSPAILQVFVLAMIALVAIGTLIDLAHKQSARYFFAQARRDHRASSVDSGTKISLALKTVAVDWLAAGEFCSTPRRLAHLLTMYGFLAYAIATIVMVFAYTGSAMPAIWPLLWHIGALALCIGGYWFWFFIRVDVTAEGHSPFHLVRADLFVLSLLANATLALIWSALQSNGSGWASAALWLYILSALVLFGSVPWSKFSHMFYKPAAAFQKRLEDANGSRNNLPLPADAPATLGSARTPPIHY